MGGHALERARLKSMGSALKRLGDDHAGEALSALSSRDRAWATELAGSFSGAEAVEATHLLWPHSGLDYRSPKEVAAIWEDGLRSLNK